MSKIKDYIDRMNDAGVDILAVDDIDNEYYEKIYLDSIKDMNELFAEQNEEVKSDKKDNND